MTTRKPQRKTLRRLVERTGIPEEWWLNGEGPPPEAAPPVPAPIPAEPMTMKEANEWAEKRIGDRRFSKDVPITREQELKAGISVMGLTYALGAILQTSPKGESIATTARKVVQLYMICQEQGLINLQDEGGENIKTAA